MRRRQRREREEEREIDSGSVTLYAKAKQMIDLNIYTESKYTALSTVYGEVVADQQLTPSASASCARRRHGSSLWPPQLVRSGAEHIRSFSRDWNHFDRFRAMGAQQSSCISAERLCASAKLHINSKVDEYVHSALV